MTDPLPLSTISVAEFYKNYFQKDGVMFIDVRTPAEFESGHALGAINIPLDQISLKSILENRTQENQQLFLICQSGKRGQMACGKLREKGINGINLEGGTLAWKQANLPMQTASRNVISLERQVRIVAGGFVLLSSLLIFLGYPAFLWLAFIVGVGLVFAGVTDTCGMALLLAKMPWNQTVRQAIPVPGAETSCAVAQEKCK